jgi:deoxyribodipyrimidine photo-lyase
MYSKSLFIFRRDLRVDDNTGLIEALHSSHEVLPCFIFDPRLLKDGNYSKNALQFMLESLADLKKQLELVSGKLYLFSGLPHEVIEKLIREESIDAVFVNCDYTPFSARRDELIYMVCAEHGLKFHQFHDSPLQVPGSVKTQQGKMYQVFTQFFRRLASFQWRCLFTLKEAISATLTSQMLLRRFLNMILITSNYLFMAAAAMLWSCCLILAGLQIMTGYGIFLL